MLPNLDIVAMEQLPSADRLVLAAFTTQASDHVWTVSMGSLLTALGSGRRLDEFAAFLEQRTEREIPSALSTLIDDIGRRTAALIDLGDARVIECTDPATAALLANDRRLRTLCHPIGDRHLAIPIDKEMKFRKALPKLGYVLPVRNDD